MKVIVIHDDSGTSITHSAKSWQSIFLILKLHKNTHFLFLGEIEGILHKIREFDSYWTHTWLQVSELFICHFWLPIMFHPSLVGFSAGDKDYVKWESVLGTFTTVTNFDPVHILLLTLSPWFTSLCELVSTNYTFGEDLKRILCLSKN